MQLFHSAGSPYARIARMAVLELGLADRIPFVETTLRDPASTLLPHNPVGRVPSLVLADGTTVTETTPILMVLDSLVAPGKRLLGDGADGWKRLAAYGRVLGMLDGIAVWNRELRRPAHERSPGVIALEAHRAVRALPPRCRMMSQRVFMPHPMPASSRCLPCLAIAKGATVPGLGAMVCRAWLPGLTARQTGHPSPPPCRR